MSNSLFWNPPLSVQLIVEHTRCIKYLEGSTPMVGQWHKIAPLIVFKTELKERKEKQNLAVRHGRLDVSLFSNEQAKATTFGDVFQTLTSNNLV